MAEQKQPSPLAAIRIQLFGETTQPVTAPPAGRLDINGKTYPVSAALALALRGQNEALKSSGAVVQNVTVGSPHHENLLSIGFGMSVEEAKQIVKERDENPLTHDYPTYVKAKSMLRQLETAPRVTSNKVPWHRERAQEL